MKKILIFSLIFTFCCALSAYADDMGSEGVEVRSGDVLSLGDDDSGPEEYTVQKGDTLWDISVDKLEDNFLWPKLWNFNPQVSNPDLIYPGDRIWIPSKEQLRRMMLPVAERVPPPVEERGVEMPRDLPPKFLIDKSLYTSIGWISGDYLSIGEIMQDPSGRSIFGNHETVYVKTGEAMAAGDRLFAIRKIKTVKHPKTGSNLGFQVRITGILEVTGMEGGFVEARTAQVFYEEVGAGDGVIPYRELDPPVVPDVIRTPAIDGYVVESHWNRLMTTEGEVVYLDKGSDDGLLPGDTFSVFSDETISRRVGTIQVVALRATTSAALITDSRSEIVLGYTWGNR